MQNHLIEVNKLEKSPQNARRSARRSVSEDLKSSIIAHGLMQNLVVTEAEGGKYRVIAGSRRLNAIRELQREGRLPKDYAAPCQIAEDGHALEMSLAENTVRLAMHPADEFEAFAKLVGSNTTEQIAERFGVKLKHVEQRLKLGRLAPRLLKEYRAEKLTLDFLMAFTVTDDCKKQLAVYDAMEDWHTARHIREMLTGQMTEATSKLAAFVGLDAYHDAGGVSRCDLFGDQVYLENPDLLNRLAASKLDAVRQELAAEGWKWVDISPECDWNTLHRCGRIQPLAESDEPQHDEGEAYDPEQMRHAGCIAFIDEDGELCIKRGLVRKEDMKHAFPAERTSRKAKGDMPQTLRRDLEAYRQQAAQAEIARHRLIAFDLLAFSVACNLFGCYIASGLNVRFGTQTPAIEEATKAGDALKAIEQSLPLAWLSQPTEAERFEEFCRLTDAEKLDLLAYAVATTLKPQLGTGEEGTAYEVALSLTAAEVAGYWRPTTANYLGRITRDQLLALGRELFGEAWSQSRSRDKKGELADQLERAFAEPEKAARNACQLAKLKSWLPSGMAFTALTEPPAKASEGKAA
jgi:ParB family transcriptional regulator, chromosome partitioning protein